MSDSVGTYPLDANTSADTGLSAAVAEVPALVGHLHHDIGFDQGVGSGALRVRARCGVQSHFLGFGMEEELALSGVGRDTRSDVYQDRHHYVWDNRSDTATLRDDRGRYVDSESWGQRCDGRR